MTKEYDLQQVVIVVQGGVVCEVYASEEMKVSIIDYDSDPNAPEPEDLKAGLKLQSIHDIGETP